MVRLVFHDAGSYEAAAGDGGVNASIRFELDRPDNFGLKRGWNVIDATHKRLAGTAAEGAVSQADLIALAGAYAVRVTEGPRIEVPVGRRDAAGADPDGRMPAQDASAEQLVANFAAKGLSAEELVVLSGSHTLGSKGYGDPLTFENTYFKTLLAEPWRDKSNEMAQHTGIPTDHVLPTSAALRPIIQRYADDEPAFFRDFAAAYVKMAGLGARWAP
ncbi:L-ascorbate peroxidase 6 [Micractinium conductrix]|uniref:L-ascorbate peroxidase n=1 Tax=Micractinium conductrix TaxID=554055 RepID=A0A2P6V9H3_9CHLO|nr:L-ascorbate peroxidase 6 [Micractinium conductrix]|eukprot:PSC70734.1 L-ascorbate peroxidase 6 [Micractinium conductrix]